jgi:hypothetical protein
MDAPRSPNLVFTSAGDRANLRGWLRGRRDFDLWVVYYGDRPDMFRAEADLYGQQKGSKFQNLHHCYQEQRQLFSRYDAVLVMDDDVLIDGTAISRLFDIRRDLDLWVMQPAFRLGGKISWDITCVRPSTKLRYTNFVEMTCPLFRRDKLDRFMDVYDPRLSAYGIDWWFLQTLGGHDAKRVAVVDEVTCVNPTDRTKDGIREIDRLESKAERMRVWDYMKKRHNLIEYEHMEFGSVERSALAAMAGVLRYSLDWTYAGAKMFAARLARLIAPALGRNESV